MESLLRECRACNKEFDYAFDYELRGYHKHEEGYTMYDFSDEYLCSKYCVATFCQLLMGEPGHDKDTFVAVYTIPIGFCDKCGDATHPTEFCELMGDVDDKQIKYHEEHLSGQGGMVRLEGKVCEVFLGQDWMVKTSGVEFANDVVQLVPDLKARAPLALVWDNVDEYSILAESICVADSRHSEKKRFLTSVEIIPSSDNAPERYYYVFQIVQKVDPVQKIFFPYLLHSVNCWFPVDACEIRSFDRYFKCFFKSNFVYSDKVDEKTYQEIFIQEVEDVDANYEAFMKGLEMIESKKNVQKEIQEMSLERMEQLSLQDVYEGEGRSLVARDEQDNVITEEDMEFLMSRGFSREEVEKFISPGQNLDQVMDDAFIEHMKCNEVLEEEKV